MGKVKQHMHAQPDGQILAVETFMHQQVATARERPTVKVLLKYSAVFNSWVVGSPIEVSPDFA